MGIISLVLGLVWFLFIGSFYFYNNPHFLGIQSFEDAGYLLSKNTLHFWIFFLIILVSYGLFYYQNAKKKVSKQRDSFTISIWKLFAIFIGINFLNYLVLFFLDSPADLKIFSGVSSFVIKSSLVYIYLLVFTFISFGTGSWIIKFTKLQFENRIIRFFITISIGLIPIFLILYLVGILGIFSSITIAIILGILFITAIPRYKDFFSFLSSSITIPLKNPFSFIFLSILLFIFANGFLDALRPLPVGWDDLTRYINYPNLLAESGQLPEGNLGWPAMLFSSIGFTLFNSEWGNILAFMTSFWFQGLILGLIVSIGSTLKLKSKGLLASLIFFTTPFVVNHTVFDSKTDLQLSAFILASFLITLLWFKQKRKFMLILVGALFGMAVGIKITAFVAALFVVLMLFYKLFRFVGIFVIGGISSLLLPIFATGYIEDALQTEVTILSVFVGIIMLGIAAFFFVRNKKYISSNWNTKLYLKSFAAIVFGFLITLGPIMSVNMIQTDFSPSIDNLIIGNANHANIQKEDLLSNPEQCVTPKINEEIVRYIGEEESITKYILLPWNMTMNNNLGVSYIDIGFLSLGFIPAGIILWAFYNYKKNSNLSNDKTLPLMASLGIGFFIWTFVGQAITWYAMPLFLFSYIIIEYILTKIQKYSEIDFDGGDLIRIALQTVLMYFGFMMGLSVLLETNTNTSSVEKIASAVFIFILFIIPIGVLQYQTIIKDKKYLFPILSIIFMGLLIQVGWRTYNQSHPVTFDYISGKYSATEFSDITLYSYRYMECITDGGIWIRDEFDCEYNYLDEDRSESNIYRISSFVPYFIGENNKRMYEDSTMTTLDCMINESESYDEVLNKLQDLNFEYLVYDTNSKSIEQDPNGPVHKRAENIESWITDQFTKGNIFMCFNDPKRSPTQFISLNNSVDNCYLEFRKDLEERMNPGQSELESEDDSSESIE